VGKRLTACEEFAVVEIDAFALGDLRALGDRRQKIGGQIGA
jgi:hypothetical protein